LTSMPWLVKQAAKTDTLIYRKRMLTMDPACQDTKEEVFKSIVCLCLSLSLSAYM